MIDDLQVLLDLTAADRLAGRPPDAAHRAGGGRRP
jgi:hypothetical protein